MDETWKQVPEFPLYEVSDHGRIRSLSRTYIGRRIGFTCPVTTKTKVINGWVREYRHGRPMVMLVALRRDGKTYCERIHRLVLSAFMGPCPEGMEGCHNDGNPLNNRVSNLRWDTHAGNQEDMVRHGTRVAPPRHEGQMHPNARLTDNQVREIRGVPVMRGTRAELARKYGVSATSIGRIMRGQQRKHG